MRFSIYQLVDPRDLLPHYVGCTRSMEHRLQGHLRGDASNPAKNAWIGELQTLGFQPIVTEIEQTETGEEARVRELWWIRELLQQGMPLLNVSGTQDELATGKLSLYLKSAQDDKLEDLRWAYKRHTGKKISANEVMCKLIDRATLESLL